LIKATAQQHPDYQPLTSALQRLHAVANLVLKFTNMFDIIRSTYGKENLTTSIIQFRYKIGLLGERYVVPNFIEKFKQRLATGSRKYVREGVLELLEVEKSEKILCYIFLFHDLIIICKVKMSFEYTK
jgi:hypothetical protein